eukprot:775016-Lingulodinium_polyedra.AAC.1
MEASGAPPAIAAGRGAGQGAVRGEGSDPYQYLCLAIPPHPPSWKTRPCAQTPPLPPCWY